MPKVNRRRARSDAQYSASGRTRRVSPLKPGLRHAQNWASARVRQAKMKPRPKWQMFAGGTAVLLGAIFCALWLGGYMPEVKSAAGKFTQSRMMAAGFVISDIEVLGEHNAREDEIRKALGLSEGDYTFAISVQTAQDRIESLDWVDRAIVRRLWPGTLTVQIIERQAAAVWQFNGEIKVVDAKGDVIVTADAAQFSQLPFWVGPEAARYAPDLNAMLAVHPELAGEVKAIVRVGERRWDLIVGADKLRIKLPEFETKQAVSDVAGLLSRQPALLNQADYIDLRQPGRAAISLKPVSSHQEA